MDKLSPQETQQLTKVNNMARNLITELHDSPDFYGKVTTILKLQDTMKEIHNRLSEF